MPSPSPPPARSADAWHFGKACASSDSRGALALFHLLGLLIHTVLVEDQTVLQEGNPRIDNFEEELRFRLRKYFNARLSRGLNEEARPLARHRDLEGWRQFVFAGVWFQHRRVDLHFFVKARHRIAAFENM